MVNVDNYLFYIVVWTVQLCDSKDFDVFFKTGLYLNTYISESYLEA